MSVRANTMIVRPQKLPGANFPSTLQQQWGANSSQIRVYWHFCFIWQKKKGELVWSDTEKASGWLVCFLAGDTCGCRMQGLARLHSGFLLSLAFLWVPVSCSVACTDFLKGRGEKKGTLACVLAPKRAVYHVLTSQGGSLVCFATKRAL